MNAGIFVLQSRKSKSGFYFRRKNKRGKKTTNRDFPYLLKDNNNNNGIDFRTHTYMFFVVSGATLSCHKPTPLAHTSN